MNTNGQSIRFDLLSMNVMMMIMLLIMMMMMMEMMVGWGGVPCYAYKQAPHWIGQEDNLQIKTDFFTFTK